MADDPRTATTLAYVGASKRVSSRLANLFHHIWPDMIGVWIMGSDRSDKERVLYGGGFEVNAAAGQFPSFKLEPSEDVELVAAWIGSADGNAARVSMHFEAASGTAGGWGADIGGPLYERSSDGEPSALAWVTTLGVSFAGLEIEVPARVSHQWPVGGSVLRAGRSMWMQRREAASQACGGFIWRVLG